MLISSREQQSCTFFARNWSDLKHRHNSRSSYDDFALHLHTNTVGPIICAQRLLAANLSIGTVVFISSDSGSATEFRDMEDGFAAYAASKAALNHMARHMAAELKRKGSGTTILLLHPGEVETDMASASNPSPLYFN